MSTIMIRDESPGAAALEEWPLSVLAERMSVREVLRSRVYQEAQDFNLRKKLDFRGLVQPTDAERQLNGPRLKAFRPVDWQKQFQRAVEAFESNQIIVLINDRQAESLDEEFVIQPGTTVTFLKLALLVGG